MERNNSRLGIKLLLALLTIGLWVVLAPVKLGGRASYIMISGGSMEPNYHYGDLIITQKTDFYSIGDAVAYYDPLLNGVIYHRIVEQVESRFVLQGDANSWLDSYEPPAEEILGKEWIILPGFGSILETARQPAWLATIAVTFILMTIWPENNEPNLEGDDEDKLIFQREGRMMGNKQQNSEYLSLSLALAGLGLIGLVYFLSRPTMGLVEKFSTARHQGEFSYRANSDEAVYEDGEANTGEPIFRNASHSITVAFDYSLDGTYGSDFEGEYRFNLVIHDDSGWEREIPLVPRTDFSTNTVSFEETVFFHSIELVLDDFAKATLVDRGTFILKFVPEVTLLLENDGAVRVSSFSPELRFVYSPLEVKMMHSQDEDVLHPVNDLVFTEQKNEESVIAFFGISFSVKNARILSGLLMVVSLCAAGYFIWTDHQTQITGGHTALLYEYGDLIVEVSEMPLSDEMVRVPSINDLISLANRHRVSVMYCVSDGNDYYFLKLPWSYYFFSGHLIDEDGGLLNVSSNNDGL